MDFSMFLELHFLFLSLSTILLFTWFIVPYFYLAEHLTRNSYTESDAANLLSIIGITNTIGMVLLILFINSFQYVSNLIFNMFSDWSWMGGRSTLDECEQNLHLVSSCLWCGNIFNVNIYSLLQFVDDYLSSVWSLLREQLQFYSCYIGTIDTSGEIHYCLWPQSIMSGYRESSWSAIGWLVI